MIVYSEADDVAAVLQSGPELSREGSASLARELFPGWKLGPASDANLAESYPTHGEIYVGSYSTLSIASATEFAPDRPSTLDARYLRAGKRRYVFVHAMHSVVDWFAYAVWKDGELIRSLSVSPDNGVIEDLGMRRDFEMPYWSGQRDFRSDEDKAESGNDYPFPFHPLEFGESALLDLFGFQLEGADGGFDPFTVSMCTYTRRRKWLRLW